jgi:predicted transposase/invertase (TIGR01784 family)
MSKISTPHDRYFKTMLSNKEVAQDFLEWHLPEFIKSRVDLSTIETKKDSFVDENFKKLETDILFSVKLDGHNGYIYTLVEAQKKPDRLMPLRLLKYLVAIMEYHFKETDDEKMPIIYPLILYKSKPEWNYTTNFFELFAEPDLAKQILINDFQLVDIHRIPEQEFDKHFWAGIFEACIKWGAKRDVINTLESLEPKLMQVFDSNKGVFVAMLTYLGNVSDTDLEQLIEWGRQLKPEIGEEIMTLAERLEEKGREEERANITRKTALKMLEEKAEIDFISRVTELSIDEIKKLEAENQKDFDVKK